MLKLYLNYSYSNTKSNDDHHLLFFSSGTPMFMNDSASPTVPYSHRFRKSNIHRFSYPWLIQLSTNPEFFQWRTALLRGHCSLSLYISYPSLKANQNHDEYLQETSLSCVKIHHTFVSDPCCRCYSCDCNQATKIPSKQHVFFTK